MNDVKNDVRNDVRNDDVTETNVESVTEPQEKVFESDTAAEQKARPVRTGGFGTVVALALGLFGTSIFTPSTFATDTDEPATQATRTLFTRETTKRAIESFDSDFRFTMEFDIFTNTFAIGTTC